MVIENILIFIVASYYFRLLTSEIRLKLLCQHIPLFTAARAFNVILKEGDKVKFYDNLGTFIPESLFSSVITTFHRGSSFFVNVKFEMDVEHRPLIVTARVIVH